MNETGEEQWWLVAQLPPSRPGTQSELDILREVNGDELRSARDANALLNRLAQAAPYARLVELFEQVEAALARTGGENPASPARTAADLNRAAVALGKAAAELPDQVLRQARDDLGEGSAELAAIEQAVAEERKRAPFRLLVAIGRLERGGFAARGDGIANDSESIAALQADVAELTSEVDLISTMRGGVLVGQRLIGRQLEVYEDRIKEATLTLRRLAVDVLDGAPALMRADVDTSQGRIDMGPASFDPLALDRSVTLLRALRHARFLLEATGERRAESGVLDEGVEAPRAPATGEAPELAEPLAPPVEEPTDAVGTSTAADAALAEAPPEATAPQAAAGEEPSEGPGEPSAESPGERADQAADLGALAGHALEFTDELERAWSGALESAALGAAHAELEARFASLLRTIERRVSAGARELREAGFDTIVPAYPLPATDYAQISFEPDLKRHWLQLQLAQFDALLAVLSALEAMRAPSATRVALPSGEVETWWEAGAFDLIRTRAHALLRVIAAADAAEDALLGKEDDATGGRALFERLELLREAINRGDTEAALLHAHRALYVRAGFEREPIPDDLLERLAADKRLGDDGVLLALLDEAVRRIRDGRPLDPGAAAVIASPVARLVGSLCLERPEIIRDVLGGATADGKPQEATDDGQ